METPTFLGTLKYCTEFYNGFDLYTLKKLCKAIPDILDIRYISPRRLTITRLNTCTICEKGSSKCEEILAIHFADNFGWISCPKCRPHVEYSKAHYIIKNKIINIKDLDKFHKLRDNMGDIIFFRRSINKIQRDSRPFNMGNQVIMYNKEFKSLTILIEWNYHPSESGRINSYYREVSLCNLIYHNRSQFGYTSSDFPIKLDYSLDPESLICFNKKIKKEYNIVNGFYLLKLIINRISRRIIDNHSIDLIRKYCFIFNH